MKRLIQSVAVFLPLALAGCFHVNVPINGNKDTVRREITAADLQWIRPNATTRTEVLANWGPPSFELSEDRLLGYAWETGKGADWSWQFGKEPVTGTWGGGERHVAVFAFDPQERVWKFGILPVNEPATIENAAKDWLNAGGPATPTQPIPTR